MRRCVAMRRLLHAARTPPPVLQRITAARREPGLARAPPRQPPSTRRSSLHTYTVDPFVRSRRKNYRRRPWTGLELTCLGTGAGGPSVDRNAACVALRLDAHGEQSTTWLFDCGEGTTRQVMSSPISHADIDRIFITHLHGDHLWGLPGFLATWSDMKTNENKIKHIRYGRNQGPRELTVYGPEGLYDYLCSTLTYSQVPPRQNAAVKVVEIASSESANRNPKQKPHGSLVHSGIVEEGTIVETSTHVVSCARIVHRPGLDAYGFVVEEVALPRKVLVEEARRAGLTPGPLYQHLQAGQDVVLQDGTVVKADDVTQENVRPRKVVIVGDTCDASALVPLAENADIVVHEATLEDEQWILARRHGHSTAGGAGRFAAKAKAKALILTHMSSRHHSVKHLERLREQARKSFGRQEVVLGRDFMAVPVPRGGFTT